MPHRTLTMLRTIIGSALISPVLGSTATDTVHVKIQASKPDKALLLAPDLVSFSIESDHWTDWAGRTERNEFFYNALDNLKQITGHPPMIRVGGNSEDLTTFDANVSISESIETPPTATVPYPEAANNSVGDGYWLTSRFLPSGTRMIWGVNFGQDKLTNAVEEAKGITRAFQTDIMKSSGVSLDAIEIGNEPNFYGLIGHRNTSWNSQMLVDEWITWARNITDAVGLGDRTDGPELWTASFKGDHGGDLVGNFSVESLIVDGLYKSDMGALSKTINMHYYSGSFCAGTEGLLQSLMTKSTIRSNISLFAPDIEAAHSVGRRVVFGETNSYSCHGSPGVSNTAGAALWAIDYTLFARTAGFEQVFYHNGIGYKYNLLQPASLNRSIVDGTPLPSPQHPHIQPAYYSAILVAELIGNRSDSSIVELSIDDQYLSGYAIYSGDSLKRAVFINSQAYLSSDSDTARPSRLIKLDYLASTVSSARDITLRAKRLEVQFADDVSGLLFGNQTYETPNLKVSGHKSLETILLGKPIEIHATEAVLVKFESS